MGLLRRSGICALALIAGSAALQFEPAVVRDLVFDDGSQRIAIGAVRVPLWSAAFAQSSDTFSLDDVSFTFGGADYEAKRIEFSGMTLSRAEIEALFSPVSTEPLASRLARVSAKQIAIPEVKVKQPLGKESESIVYRNVALNDIIQGRVASLVVEASGGEMTGQKGPVLLSYGRTTISDMDLPGLANLFEAKSDNAPLAKIYGAIAIDGIDLVESTKGVNLRIARFAGRDFLARPTKDSWAGIIAVLAEQGSKAEPSNEDKARFVSIVADILGAFDMGLAEATGIELKTAGKDNIAPASARIDRIAYTGATGPQPSDIRVEGMEIGNQESRVGIGTLSLTGFSLAPTVNGLKALQGKSLDDLDPATLRSLIPTIGTLRLSGFDIDAANKDEKGAKPERIKASLKDFEFTADTPVNAVPTNIRIGMRNFAMALPPTSQDGGVKEFLALGYKAIDMSFLVAAKWNEATSEIVLKEASIQGQDMGNLSLTGLIGGIGKDVFSADTTTATLALMGAKAKSLDLAVENTGMFERYLAKTAKEQKTTPDALRKLYAFAAPGVVSALLGGSEQAKGLGKAVARFIAKPKHLTITARPKDRSGIGVADLFMVSEPAALIDKLDITATSE